MLMIGQLTNAMLASMVRADDLVDTYIGTHEDGLCAREQGAMDIVAETQELCTLLAARFTAAHWAELHERRS